MFNFTVVDTVLQDLFQTSLRSDQAHVWGQKLFELEGRRFMFWSDFQEVIGQLAV